MTETVTRMAAQGPQLGRIQYIDPDTSLDPWDCHYYGIPRAKTVYQYVHELHDLRPEIFQAASPYSLETHAFTAVKHKSKLDSPPHTRDNFMVTENLENVYLPEVIELVKSVTGAKKCFIISSSLRQKEAEPAPRTEAEKAADPPAEPERCGFDVDIENTDLSKPMIVGNGRIRAGPARSVHVDYSPYGARQMIRHLRRDITEEMQDIIDAEDEAAATGEEYTGRRYALYSIWRPLKPVVRDPLAICDPNTINPRRDLAEHTNKQPGMNGDYLAAINMLSGRHAATQKWYWIKDQKEDEVYFIQFFDNYAEKDERPVGAPHGSPELLNIGEKEVRQSSETRVIAVW